MRYSVVITFLVLGLMNLSAQEENSPNPLQESILETQVNLGSLVSQFIPFGNSTFRSGPFYLNWLSGKNNNLFRVSVGANIEEAVDFFNSDRDYVALGVGYTRRFHITPKFIFDQSILFTAYSGGLNIPRSSFTATGAMGICVGFAPYYKLADKVKLGTEVLLFMGYGQKFSAKIVPPISINLAVGIK